MPTGDPTENERAQVTRAQANAMRQLAAAIELLAAVEALKAGIKPQDARKWLDTQRPAETKQRPRRLPRPTG
jgi:hypothetical protein